MSNLRTQISWMLHDYCTSECSYCPTQLRGGLLPKGILDYMDVTTRIIDHYDSIGRKVDWTFSGGEPLDMFDFPMMLKLCKERGGNIDLTTNGGKLWLDWWAIEPHIDQLHLSYHYWQNPKLIRFIIQTFQKAGKHIEVIVPMRPDHFDEDLKRALDIESEFNIIVSKAILYKEANQTFGMFFYDDRQISIMLGEESVQERKQDREITVAERFEKAINASPSYTGQLCNLGIERLTISHTGWVRGSNCNTTQFGNIWDNNFALPTTPQRCVMVSCMDGLDQQITKFNQ
jgi:MoaA/NifB/PqqE/SkfB family radical SAM enzyme